MRKRWPSWSDPPAARLLMQAIGVLGDDPGQLAVPFESGQRFMGGIGPGIGPAMFAAVAPVLRWIGAEGIDVRDLVRIEFRPQSPLAAIHGDSALLRDPGAGKRDGGPGPAQQRRGVADGGLD